MRKIKFYPPVFSSGKEKELLIKTLKSNQWSSFKGALEGSKASKVLKLNSKKANSFKPLSIRFLGGKYVRKLEAKFANMYGVKFCVSANSATSCLSMAIGSLNLGPGDEVLLPSMSFVSTATSILTYNCIPVFCEVKKDTFCIDPIDVEKKITKRTKAIIVVHLAGNSCEMKKILKIAKKYNLKIIEDCAQAIGVKYNKKYLGTFGDIGVFSLTETKNITCGEGGLIITNNNNLAMKSRLIRNHGENIVDLKWKKKDLINIVGMNYRLTEFQAAVAIPQLESLRKRNMIRKKLFNRLKRGLDEFKKYLIIPQIEKHTDFVPYIVKLLWKPKINMINRNQLVSKLNKMGVPVSKGYSKMMHELPIFTKKVAYKNGCPFYCDKNSGSKINYGTGSLPVSEKINKQFIWFKFINPPNSNIQIDYTIDCFKKAIVN